ncbi:hypothetical protein [Paracoccus actinidiae]|nr:hypothetical protein [Paracoccus sp. M09]
MTKFSLFKESGQQEENCEDALAATRMGDERAPFNIAQGLQKIRW